MRRLLGAAEEARANLRQSIKEGGEKMLETCERSKQMEQLLIGSNRELTSQNLVLTRRYLPSHYA